MLSNSANLIYGIMMTSGAQTAADLAVRTSMSQPAVSRALNEVAQHTGRLVTHRQGRKVIYAISRQIRALPVEVPIYQVAQMSEHGIASLMGNLIALEGGRYLFVAANGESELLDGLPWFLQDMRPQGFIGRAFCHAHAENLGLSDRLTEWTEDDVLYALATLGDDSAGNLIVGTTSLRRFMSGSPKMEEHLSSASLAKFYDQLADIAVHGGQPGSSAAGEHPKFLTQYRAVDGVHHVVVKFSPILDGTAVPTRWKDLLIAEHTASDVLGEHGIDVPGTRIILSGNRCYLESTRYDRMGARGRIGVVTFDAIDNALIGAHRNWSQSGSNLCAMGMIDGECEERIRIVETFGRFIGNTDMHFGNMSFYWAMQDGKVKLRLAPIYDMLPMLYAPEKSEVTNRTFNPPMAESIEHELLDSVAMAREFWERLAGHDDVSEEFRDIASQNAEFCGDQAIPKNRM